MHRLLLRRKKSEGSWLLRLHTESQCFLQPDKCWLIVSYGLTFTLIHILIGRHGVALSLNNTARRGDLVLDEHLATVLTIRDGKISAIDTYLSDIDMLNAFFVSK